MRILFAALSGFALDLLIGDPASLAPIHPVVWMGRCIRALEGLLRRLFPKTPRGERAAGAVLAAALPLGTLALCGFVLWGLGRLCPPAALALEIVWCAQALAVKNLRDEAMGVCRALESGTLDEARGAVSRIVGRETASLSREGVIRAAVETVAENFSDGAAAPMFCMLLGGAPLALCYKAVNTMDSMVGYRSDRYLYFGRCAAKLDDAANFLPSRLAALILIAAAALTGQDGREALRVWRRDRRKHASPNSAQCESAMAGALGVRLGGPAVYFGRTEEKPWLGDERRSVEPEDIRRACRMEYAGSGLCMVVFCLIRLGIVLLVR